MPCTSPLPAPSAVPPVLPTPPDAAALGAVHLLMPIVPSPETRPLAIDGACIMMYMHSTENRISAEDSAMDDVAALKEVESCAIWFTAPISSMATAKATTTCIELLMR